MKDVAIIYLPFANKLLGNDVTSLDDNTHLFVLLLTKD